MGDFYDLASRRKVELDELRKVVADRDRVIAVLREDLVDRDREIKALRDELDYVHGERDDFERQLADRPPTPAPAAIPWLREVEPERWEITDRD